MKKKALHKDFFMEIKKSYTRFLSIFFIVSMGVAFYSGIQSAAPDMRYTGDAYFDTNHLMDLKVLSTLGLTDKDVAALLDVKGIKNAKPGYMADVLSGSEADQKVLHIESMVPSINQLTVTEGELPKESGECFLDEEFMETNGYKVGDTIELKQEKGSDEVFKKTEFKIVGMGNSPSYISFSKGNTTLGTGELSGYGFVLADDFDQEAYAFAYLEVDGAKELTAYTQEYDDLVADITDEVKGIEQVQCDQRLAGVKTEAKEKLTDAKTELEDGKKESAEKLTDAEKEITDGEKKLADGKDTLEDSKKKIAESKDTIESKQKELDDAKAEITSGEKALADGKKTLVTSESEYKAQYPAMDAKLRDGEKAIADGKKQLADGRLQYNEGKSQYDAGYAQYIDGKKQLDEGIKAYQTGKKQLDEAKRSYESGAAQLETAKKQYEAGKKKYDTGKKQYEAGMKEFAAAKKSYEEGMASVKKYDDGIAALAAARSQYEAGIVQLNAAKTEYETGKTQLSAAKEQYKAGKAQFDSSKALYDSGRAEYNKAKGEYDAGMAGLNQKRAAYNEGMAKLQESKTKLTQLEALITEGKATPDQIAQAESLRVSIPVKEKELQGENQLIQTTAAKLEAANQVLKSKESELAAAKQKLDASEQQLMASKKEIDANEQKLAVGKQEIDSNEQRLAAAKKEIDTNTQLLESSKPQIEAARAELAKAKKEIETYEKTLSESKKQLDASEAQLTNAKKQISDNEKKLTQGKKQIDDNSKKLAAAKKVIDEKQPDLIKAKEVLDASAAKLGESKKTLDDSEALLNEKEKQVTDGRAQLNAAAAQIQAGKDEIASKEVQLKEGKEKLEDGQIQIDDGKKELKSAEKKIKDAEKEIADNEKKLADGRKDYEEGKKEADEKIADGEKKIADAEKKISDLKDPKWIIQDRSSLPEHIGYGENADRISNIGEVFPVLFFLVAALISLTTMTRMVEEERTQIGTLKALGYSKMSIASKYLNYALLATIGGSIFGVLIGEKILPYIIITAYGIMYHHMPDLQIPYNMEFALISTGTAVICTMGATFAACYKELAATPAALMRPPAPKEGKRVLLERITFIWKHLSFTWKSTVRNLFRYKKRFLMTIFGIGGCMALLMVGFGLRDSIMNIAVLQYQELQIYDGMVIKDSDASTEEKAKLETSMSGNGKIQAAKDILMKKDTVMIGKKEMSLYLYVPKDIEGFEQFVNFRDRKTREVYKLGNEGIILTEKIANMMDLKAGDSITIQDEDKGNVEVKISAICENYMAHYAYMSADLYEKLYSEKPEYNSTLFKVTEDSKDSVETIGQDILKNEAALSVSYSVNIMSQLGDMLSSLDVVMVVLIVSAGMLAFVVLYNLNNININERRRELATIKVLGFYDNEVSAYVYRENILLTAFGVLLGIVLGVLLHRYTIVTVEVDACMFGRNINWPSFIYSILFTVGFSVIVNIVMYFKLKKIDMVESLKSVE